MGRRDRHRHLENEQEGGSHDEAAFAAYGLPLRHAKARQQPLVARTAKQDAYITAIRNASLTYGIGPAGTGKTYLVGAVGAIMLKEKQIERLILTRPVVEAGGEHLGFLPGDGGEKFDPYFQPFKEVLEEWLGRGAVEYMIKAERIVAVPLAYLRGHTFRNALAVMDEAQNANRVLMKMFLTRMGEGTRAVVNGDPSQIDLPQPHQSGLMDAIERTYRLTNVRVVQFAKEDVVRSGLVQEIVEAYETPARALDFGREET